MNAERRADLIGALEARLERPARRRRGRDRASDTSRRGVLEIHDRLRMESSRGEAATRRSPERSGLRSVAPSLV